MKKALMFTLALVFGFTLKASDVPKTLPPAMYDAMKSGKKLDKVFVDPAYGKLAGFKVAPIDYKAENRSTAVLEGMTKSLGMLAKSDSVYTLHVTVIKVTTKTFTGFGSVMGKVTVEGRIVDADGKVVVAFVTGERAGSFATAADDYQVACDKIASAIAKDLL